MSYAANFPRRGLREARFLFVLAMTISSRGRGRANSGLEPLANPKASVTSF